MTPQARIMLYYPLHVKLANRMLKTSVPSRVTTCLGVLGCLGEFLLRDASVAGRHIRSRSSSQVLFDARNAKKVRGRIKSNRTFYEFFGLGVALRVRGTRVVPVVKASHLILRKRAEKYACKPSVNYRSELHPDRT